MVNSYEVAANFSVHERFFSVLVAQWLVAKIQITKALPAFCVL